MRFKILILVSLALVLHDCKKNEENQETETTEQNNTLGITSKDIEALEYTDYALDPKTQTIIQDWNEYLQIQDVITGIKTGDLSFFNDNKKAINVLSRELKKNIPEPIKSTSIEARLLVVDTKLYKLESLSNLSTTGKTELLQTIKEFLVAFSNFKLQMNKKLEFDTQVIEKPA